MSLPSEYVIEDAVRSIDDVIVYRADHPIHGTVNVYLPDDTLPPALARAVKKRLYQNGLQMRNISLLDVPLATKALEVSQNPNEPYIVTKHTKHDLESLISNGVTIKPKRTFAILSQVLEAIINLSATGWVMDRVHTRQVKLSQLLTGDISFTVIEGAEQQIDVIKTTPAAKDEPDDADTTVTPQPDAQEQRASAATLRITQRIDETQEPEDIRPAAAAPPSPDHTASSDENVNSKDAQKQSRMRQRNIYLLGNITYQLLFGRKHVPTDKAAAANIRELARRWQKILEKALSQDIDYRYDTYEAVLKDLSSASNRNKRVALASIPFLLVLVLIGSYFAYRQYHRYKIMTSGAGQAIESFLEIVDQTDSEFPNLEKPEPPAAKPDEKTILRPFDKIDSVDED